MSETNEEQGRPKAPESEGEGDAILIAAVFAAAAAGDAAALAAALLTSSSSGDAASYQDPATGRSALFSAAEADSVECVALLLEAGAPWNAIDREGSCAGDAAVAAGSEDAASALLEAGVRAELVLGALSEAAAATSSSSLPPAAEEGRPYLKQRATFHASASDGAATLSDEQGRAVMMEWEAGIMKATAHAVAKGARKNEDGSGGGVGEFFLFARSRTEKGRGRSSFFPGEEKLKKKTLKTPRPSPQHRPRPRPRRHRHPNLLPSQTRHLRAAPRRLSPDAGYGLVGCYR